MSLFSRPVAAFAALGISLAACGQGKESPDKPAAPAPVPAAPAAPVAPAEPAPAAAAPAPAPAEPAPAPAEPAPAEPAPAPADPAPADPAPAEPAPADPAPAASDRAAPLAADTLEKGRIRLAFVWSDTANRRAATGHKQLVAALKSRAPKTSPFDDAEADSDEVAALAHLEANAADPHLRQWPERWRTAEFVVLVAAEADGSFRGTWVFERGAPTPTFAGLGMTGLTLPDQQQIAAWIADLAKL
jgi:hypothetical protein